MYTELMDEINVDLNENDVRLIAHDSETNQTLVFDFTEDEARKVAAKLVKHADELAMTGGE